MTITPGLSVVLVAREAVTSLSATIASLLAQTTPGFELLVVDDGSCDGAANALGSLSDQRLRVIRLPAPGNDPHCWNRALEASRSPLFMIVTAGDRLHRSALADMVAALERDPSAGLAHAWWFGTDADGRILLRTFREYRRRALRRIPEDLDYRRALVVDGDLLQALPTWRRDILASLGGFDESLGGHARYAAALRLLDHSEIRVVPRFFCGRPGGAGDGGRRSRLREIAICRSLSRAGAARYLAAGPYRWSRSVLVGLLPLDSLRDLAGRAYWRIRRGLRRVSPVRSAASRLYRMLVGRMSWWPLGGARRPAPPRDAPLRVSYVLWRYPLLSETFIRREIHALRESGVTVEVVADAAGESDAEDHPAAPVGEAVYLDPVDPVRLRRFTRSFRRTRPLRFAGLFLYTVFHRYTGEKALARDARVFRRAVYLAGVLRERGVTHVHSPWADQHAFLALLASRLLGIPFSVQARAHEIHRRTANVGLADKLRNAAFVVTNSAFNAAHLQPLLGGEATARLHTIYNGLDLARFEPPARRNDGPRVLRILSIGRLVEQKGFDYLLEACAMLRDRGLAFRCDIIGGPQEPEDTNSAVLLRKLHRRLQLDELVHFQGERPFSGVLEAYRQADIFALPCVIAADGGSDVTPNALIEAMAMGLPVVSTPIAAIPEIVDAGTSGTLVPPRDPAVLADALAALLTDAGLRARLGAAARRRVEERFDIARNIGRYVALFRGSDPVQAARLEGASR